MNDTEGLIVKATGGFYYVDAAGVLYECRARGVFRKQGVSPLVGDRVTVEPAGESKGVVAVSYTHLRSTGKYPARFHKS